MSVLFADFLPVQEKYPKKQKLGLDFSRALVYNVKAVSDGGKDGRLAQLEEHLLDVQGVRGSSPLPPTTAWPRRSRRGTPYPAPSKEGALRLFEILAAAWSLKCQNGVAAEAHPTWPPQKRGPYLCLKSWQLPGVPGV